MAGARDDAAHAFRPALRQPEREECTHSSQGIKYGFKERTMIVTKNIQRLDTVLHFVTRVRPHQRLGDGPIPATGQERRAQ